jgi:glycosyltransferase involved in cell wall biosynthesis
MRVLILSQYFWPESFRINEVAITLRDAGCDVIILTGQPNYPDGAIFNGYSACGLQIEVNNELEIHRVPLFPRGQASVIRLACNYLSFVFSAVLFGPWQLRGCSIDRILVYAPSPILQAIPAIWLGWLKGAAVVTWVQDLWPDSLYATGYVKNRVALACVNEVVKWIYRRCDLLLAQSEAFVQPIEDISGGTPVLYYPNPGELLHSCNTSKKLPFEFEEGFNVVFAGNLGTAQALDILVEAAYLLRFERDIKIVIVGSGSRFEWLRSEVNRLGLRNVSLPGRLAQEDMPGVFAKASALLVSLNRSSVLSKTIPAKVQAYLAAGVPIIASMDGEGARVVKRAGAGLTCPAGDATALTNAIIKLRNYPREELDQMGQNAKKYYQANFEPKMLAVRLIQVLRDLKNPD